MIQHTPGDRAFAQHADVRLHRLAIKLQPRVGETPRDWTEVALLAGDQRVVRSHEDANRLFERRKNFILVPRTDLFIQLGEIQLRRRSVGRCAQCVISKAKVIEDVVAATVRIRPVKAFANRNRDADSANARTVQIRHPSEDAPGRAQLHDDIIVRTGNDIHGR